MQTAEQLAQTHGLPLDALNSLITYMRGVIQRATKEQLELVLLNPDAFITEGVKQWHKQGTQFLNMLAHGTSEEARAMRTKMANEVWTTIRTQQGLPV